MTTIFQPPMFPRLEPRTPLFQGGRIAETDVLNLTEAARFASVHAGVEITSADFLRAAGRGEITMRAIVHQTAKLQRIGGGVYCNAGQPNENTAPNGSILTLPLSACEHLAAAGRASWRKFEGFEQIDGQLMRYVIAELTPDEPDFETTPDDCRFTGNAVHALADAYTEAPAQAAATPAPVIADEIAFDMVATRQQLIDAYGSFTGMSIAWFDNLNTSPRLKAARKYTGQGGRHSAEPLFCPYEVMQWLADPKRKKGRKLGNEKAWQLLKAHFPKAYAPNSIGDPNAD